MSVHKDKKTNTYYYETRLYNEYGEFIKRTKKRGFKLKKDAQKAQLSAELEAARSEHDCDKITFEEVKNHYLKVMKNRCKTDGYNKAERTVNCHLTPYFGNRKMSQISNKSIVDWQLFMSEKTYIRGKKEPQKYSVSFLQDTHTYLSSIFKHGMKYFNLKTNPASIVGNFKSTEPPKEMSFWTITQFRQFYQNIKDEKHQCIFAILFMLGVRKGEMRALRWCDLDIENKVIHVRHTVHRDGSLGSPKSPSSIRDLLLDTFTLDRILNVYKHDKNIAGFSDKFFIVGGVTHLSNTKLDNIFDKYYGLVDLNYIRIHDFRHSNASYLISKGADIQLVSKRLGHKSVTITLEIYGHLYPDKENNIIDLIDVENRKVDLVS